MGKPLFSSFNEFAERAGAAGLTSENCAYVAANQVSAPYVGGMDISSEEAVLADMRKAGNEPLAVELYDAEEAPDPRSIRLLPTDPMMLKCADIGCMSCGMVVTVQGGYSDVQRVSLRRDRRECPIFREDESSPSSS